MNEQQHAHMLKLATGQLRMHVQVTPADPSAHVKMAAEAVAFALAASLAVFLVSRIVGVAASWIKADI